jgi:hypothetical protein
MNKAESEIMWTVWISSKAIKQDLITKLLKRMVIALRLSWGMIHITNIYYYKHNLVLTSDQIIDGV